MTAEEIAARIVGSWRLVETWRQEIGTGRRVAQMGPAPAGLITYTPAGRMHALLTATAEGGPRSPTDAERAALHASMVGYAGRWEAAADGVRHHVEVAWTPALVGDVFHRNVRFMPPDRLVLESLPGPSAMDGVLSVVTILWQRMA